MRGLLGATAVVMAALWAAAWISRLHVAGPMLRRDQHQLHQLETTPDASMDWFRVLSRDPEACTVEQYIRAGTLGFYKQVWAGAPRTLICVVQA